jgi:hypothetical protein
LREAVADLLEKLGEVENSILGDMSHDLPRLRGKY